MATAVPASSSTTPGHKNAGQMISEVASYVQADTTDTELASVVLSALNSGIGLCNSRLWQKLVKSSDLTMTASDDDIGLPADFKEPMAVFQLNSSDVRTQRLPFKPMKSLLEEDQNNATSGIPQFYGINYGTRELILNRQPSSAWVSSVPQLRVYYFRRLAELTQNSSTIDAEPEWEWFLIWHARREMAAIHDPAKFGLADRMAQQYWQMLIRNDTNQMSDWSEYY